MTAPSEELDAAKPARLSPELRSTLRFLAVPVGFYVLILIFHLNQIPLVLPIFAAIFGIVLFARSLRDPEPLLAVVILYMPLSKQFVASYAPGLNGTNALLLMLVISWTANASRDGRPMFVGMRNTTIVGAWAAISILSGLTAMLRISTDFILDEHLQDFVGWCMQFVVFFAFVNMIRDGRMARRLVVYICITFFLIICLGVQDLIDKMDATSIEKSRLLGPQGQPNDYGAWLVYSMAPLIAYFIHNVFTARAWLLAPLFVVVAKILLTTFSRGAYIGLGVATVAAGWVRGKAFLLAGGLLAVTILFVFPQVVPTSSTRAQRLGSYSGRPPSR
jgi:putative inorganic carbon (hco3(-)) transporter